MLTPNYKNSRTTIELRDIVDNGENSIDIWNFDYPSFYKDEAKKAFEQKVIDHYYFREIGQETVGRWLHYFRSKIREIMPYYIQLYKSEEIMNAIEDPFATLDVTEEYTANNTDTTNYGKTNTITPNVKTTVTNNSTFTTESDSTNKFSDTPQGNIGNLDTHLTNATINNESSENTNNGTVTTTQSGSDTSQIGGTDTSTHNQSYTLKRKGSQGVTTYAHDMIEYRTSFLNIDMMIIDELNDLFIKIY